jgi:hypothetical protein
MKAVRILVLGCVLLSGLSFPGEAAVKTLEIPLTLEYPLVRSLLINHLFSDPGQKAIVVDEEGGCRHIQLWAPETMADGSLLKITCRIKVRAGVRIIGLCFDPVEWQGYIEVWQRVHLEPGSWRLHFQTVESNLLGEDRQPATVAGFVWKLVKSHVHAYLDQFAVNLEPPVQDLGIQLPLLFRPEMEQKVKAWLSTLRSGPVEVNDLAMKVPLAMDVEVPKAQIEEEKAPRPLAQADLDAFTRYWEAWDSYLVHQILALSRRPLSPDEKWELLAVLLDMRYGFLEALQNRYPKRDLVREQFLETWRRLTPILRKHLTAGATPSLLYYLAFFTANDALTYLDHLGPSLGLDISIRGMRRMARLISREDVFPALEYSYTPNQELRRTLGWGPLSDQGGPAFDGLEMDLKEPDKPQRSNNQNSFFLKSWFVRPAYAATRQSRMSELIKWLPPRGKIWQYFQRVKDLTEQSASTLLDNEGLEPSFREPFRNLVLATAWQESCWRQFVRAGDKIRCLRSYNQTSVGLMQINERVWRGIYSRQKLRWDIAYNAKAGCEILKKYLMRYGLNKMDAQQPEELDLLIKSVYAMYNGGPKQFQRYMERSQRNKLFLSDVLFAQKLAWVEGGVFEKALKCLGGEP